MLRARLLCLLAAAAVAAPFLPATATPRPAAPRDVTVGPLESGTTSYVRGTYAWTDYAYDDRGPNTAAGGQGSATYPDAADQSNAADLVQLQARVDEGRLRLTAVLETLTRADEPLLGLGFDSDGDTRTGAASVPGGQWHGAGALGLDEFVTASSDGAALLRWTGTAWQQVSRLPAHVDPADNTLTTSVPLEALHAGHALRTVAVLGLRRPAASWLAGTGPVYDLAFVHGEEPTSSGGALVAAEQVAVTGSGHATGGLFQDVRQADVLAGHLPAADGVASLDLDAMRAGATRLPTSDSPGYHTRLYHSGVALPEGIVDGTAAGGLWAGPYQPYLVQVPPHPAPDMPVLLYLHGGGGNHLDNGVFVPQGDLSLGGALGVFPYGREVTTAQDHGYDGVSEQDVLDVLTDARRSYATDATRTVVAGVSTGVGGALRLAQLHPDLFSGVLVVSAYDDTHVIENLVNVPVVLHNGGLDPAVSPPVAAMTPYELDGFGDVGYRAFLVAGHSHGDTTGPISQCLVDQLLRTPGVQDPARVVLGLDPANDPAGLPAGTHLRHDRAYWLQGMTVRAGAPASPYHSAAGDPPAAYDNTVARADVTSLAAADRVVTATPVRSAGENASSGATLCGPDPATKTNDAWTVHGLDLARGPAAATSNGATLGLRQVGDLTLDLARMGLSTRRPLTLQVTGDGPVTLTLAGSWGGVPVRVTVDGKDVGDRRARAGALALSLDLTGAHTVVLTR